MANRTRYFANRLSITPVDSNALHWTTIFASQMLKCLDLCFHLMSRPRVTPCTRCVSRELWWTPLDDFSTQLKVKLFYFRFLFTTLIYGNSIYHSNLRGRFFSFTEPGCSKLGLDNLELVQNFHSEESLERKFSWNLLSTILWLDAWKIKEKIIRENAFEQQTRKPRIKFNHRLALIGLQKTGKVKFVLISSFIFTTRLLVTPVDSILCPP